MSCRNHVEDQSKSLDRHSNSGSDSGYRRAAVEAQEHFRESHSGGHCRHSGDGQAPHGQLDIPPLDFGGNPASAPHESDSQPTSTKPPPLDGATGTTKPAPSDTTAGPSVPAPPGSIFQRFGLSIPETALQPGSGHVYYVDASAGKVGNGGQNSPFKTIQEAAKIVHAGDTVYVAPGEYHEDVNVTASGVAGDRIKFISTEQGGAKLVGEHESQVFHTSGNYVSVIGFSIDGGDVARVGLGMGGNFNSAIGNNVYNVHDYKDGNGSAGIDFEEYQNKDGTDVQGSFAYGNVVHDLGSMSSPSSPGAHGIYLSNPNAKLVGNVTYNDAGGGIHLWHNDTYGIEITNNLSFHNDDFGIVTGGGDNPWKGAKGPEGMQIHNNMLIGNFGPAIDGEGKQGNNNVVKDNFIYGNTGPNVRSTNPSGITETGTVSENPTSDLVNYQADGSGDYSVKQGSKAAQNHMGPGFVDPNLYLPYF